MCRESDIIEQLNNNSPNINNDWIKVRIGLKGVGGQLRQGTFDTFEIFKSSMIMFLQFT